MLTILSKCGYKIITRLYHIFLTMRELQYNIIISMNGMVCIIRFLFFLLRNILQPTSWKCGRDFGECFLYIFFVFYLFGYSLLLRNLSQLEQNCKNKIDFVRLVLIQVTLKTNI